MAEMDVPRIKQGLPQHHQQRRLRDEGRGTLKIRNTARADTLRIAFEENGPGIPPDVLSRIFDPFFTTKPEGEWHRAGALGESGMVQSHGGTIDVESEGGAGAIFTVTLPLKTTATTRRTIN